MPTNADVKAKLDALTAGVAAFDDVEASVKQFCDNQAKQISDLKTAAANTGDVPQEFLDQLDAIQTALSAHKDKIAAEVTANTPAA